MDILNLIRERRSVRRFLPRDVEQTKLDYVIECARLAPSAANRQPWKFFIVKNEDCRTKLYESYPSKWFSTEAAPVIIVACADMESSWKRSYDAKDYADVDIAIAFEHICLAAVEQGLGTCWIAHFKPDVVREVLSLPENLVPIAMTPLGYPHPEGTRETPRKAKEEIIETI